MTDTSFANARAASDWLRGWLAETAYPVWAEHGVDRVQGGFFEKIASDYQPTADPRRTRVVGRQIFCFARAPELGWRGDAMSLVDHGLDFLISRSLKQDGLVFSSVTPQGAPVRGEFDLYDHAFALFGLAEAAKVRPARRDDIVAAGRRMHEAMARGFKHPRIGYEEAQPRRLPLLANPHMHLLEAFLAFQAVDDDPRWRVAADEIAHLAMTHLIDAERGCLREYFDGDWRPAAGDAGRIVEPGHQFEWAWLLCRWARNDAQALAAARRLCAIGETHGVDAERGVAIGELRDDLSPVKRETRIWAQCERIKAHVAMAELAASREETEASEAALVRAVAGLRLFLLANAPGLWRDKMQEDGHFADEHAPASSLYHIVFAACELARHVRS